MARIQLRDTTIFFQDGLFGTAAVGVGDVADAATTVPVKSVATNVDDSTATPPTDTGIPVGARITFAGDTTIYTVQTSDDEATTTSITINPAKDGAALEDVVITVLPQRLEIKVGEGDVSWSESREFIYDLDRDELDTVRLGQDQPMSVDMAFTFDFVTAGTGSIVPSPADALNRVGPALNWVSSSSDPCEPYAVDVIIIHCVPCGGDEDQEITLPFFRYESLDYSIADASVSVSGQCNALRADVERSTHDEC